MRSSSLYWLVWEKRSLTVNENITHSELTDLLLNAYPKLGSVCGGWLLHKAAGGGGQRKLPVIPPDSDGYTGQQLKGVSANGKSIIYIAPIQENMDTTPLPPEAKEFEHMPKVNCTTCGKMFPLQVLPLHIKSCKEETIHLHSSSDDDHHVSSDFAEDQGEMSAECPVCRGVFHIEMIESHASECGLRIVDSESNGTSSNEQNFQSAEDVLQWLNCQVDEGNTFSLCISRSDLFTRGIQQWQRQKKSSPRSKLKVSFFGEAGIDTGALSKEFLTEMVAEIEKRLFLSSPDVKGNNPRYCLTSLDLNYFRTAGEIMAASLAQGGPPPNFLRKWCYTYLCSGDVDYIQVSACDVTDLELTQLIMEVNTANSENISKLTDDIIICGYTGNVSPEKKDMIIRSIVLHSTMRVIPMLDQLRKGLQLYGLLQVMEAHPDICLPLFVPTEDDKVDAAFILEKCQPVFSERGSMKYTREANIMNFFQDFLQETEDCEQDHQTEESEGPHPLTVGRVMQWITGQAHKPLLPSEKKDFIISVRFDHDCNSHAVCFPTVSACSRTITFPVAHLTTLAEFQSIMKTAIQYGQSFDRV